MAKNSNKKFNLKTIGIIILMTPIAAVLLVLLLIWGFFALDPLLDHFDRGKFVSLDSQMQKIFSQIKSQANSDDDWRYKAVCEANKAGDFSNGTYNCVTSISMQKTVSSVEEVNTLHSKYYPTVDNSDLLTNNGELITAPQINFGQYYVVSSIERSYTENSSSGLCRYIAYLNQLSGNVENENNHFGSEIKNNQGDFLITLRCSATARHAWYQLSKTTSLIVP